eukprot:COSAG02_NODE_22767_length_741_cov_0.785047_2_plen_42_part_01
MAASRAPALSRDLLRRVASRPWLAHRVSSGAFAANASRKLNV